MKKIISIMIVAALTVSIAGCGAKQETQKQKTAENVTQKADTKASSEKNSQKGDDEYTSLDSLNSQLKQRGSEAFEVKNPTNKLLTISGYKYDAESNIAEIYGRYDVGEGADFQIRITKGSQPGIYGIGTAEKAEDFANSAGETVSLYRDKNAPNTCYAIWEHAGNTFSVAILADSWDCSAVVKELVNDMTSLY